MDSIIGELPTEEVQQLALPPEQLPEDGGIALSAVSPFSRAPPALAHSPPAQSSSRLPLMRAASGWLQTVAEESEDSASLMHL